MFKNGSVEQHFNNIAHTYERTIGGSTREVAKYMITLCPPTANSKILDNACGSGIITSEVLRAVPSPSEGFKINAVDIAEKMVAVMGERIVQNAWEGLVETQVMDGQDLKFSDGTFDLSYTNFGFFFLPDAVKGAKELYRTLSPTGIALVSTWKYVGYIPLIHRVQEILRPDEKPFELPPTAEPWHLEETLRRILKNGGFSEVEVVEKKAHIKAESLDGLAELITERFERITVEWDDSTRAKFGTVMRDVIEEFAELDEDEKPGIPMIAWVAIARK